MMRAAIAFALMMLGGCDRQADFDRLVPREEAAFARESLERLAAQDFAWVEARLSPELRNAAIRGELHALARVFPSGTPETTTLVGSQTDAGPDYWRARFTFEYAYPGTWLLAGVALHRDGQALLVDGINVEREAKSVAERHAVDLEDLTPAHAAVLALAIAVPLFVLHTLVACLRTPGLPMRWLWAAFVLLGVGAVSLNWTTGELAFSPLRVLLLAVGADRPLYAPLTLSVAMPLGAVAFRLRHRLAWLRR